MGMSTDMAPTYISMNPAGQMAYILDSNNINLAQVQLAVPGSEIVLIQDDSKSINLCENPGIISDASSENVTWLGNNVIVLVSQPQEYIVVEQEVVVDSNVVQTPVTLATNAPLAQLVSKENSETFTEIVEEETTTTVEDAKCWFKDSLITTAALSKLTSYIQSNGNTTKIG